MIASFLLLSLGVVTNVPLAGASPDAFYLHDVNTTGLTPAGKFMNTSLGSSAATLAFDTDGQTAFWYGDETWPPGSNDYGLPAGPYDLRMHFDELPRPWWNGESWWNASWTRRQRLTFDNSVTGVNSVEVRVPSSTDDAEELVSSGAMALGSSDLELIRESGDQEVGMRFPGLSIPSSAVILNAWIEFAVDETTSEDTDLVFHAQDADDPGTFTSSTNNITSRPKTTTSVRWDNIVAWSTIGQTHRTPNLAPIVQEVVDRSGWSPGNALVVLVTGSGQRIAQSYDLDPNTAPLLHVDYRESLVDFPVLVKLDGSRIDYGQTQDAGQDLRFLDADGTTVLDHEIERWNESGTSVVWVRVPRIDGGAQDDSIWMYYGNSGASNGENPSTVWDTDFAAVWHLNEDPANPAPQFTDSTSNGNDGTANSLTSAHQVAGQVDGSLAFDDSSERHVNVSDDASLDLATDITLSAWVNTSDTESDVAVVAAKWGTAGNRNYWLGKVNAADLAFYVDDTQNVVADLSLVNDGAWHHVVGVADSSSGLLRLYVDGTQINTSAYTGSSETGAGALHIGNSPDASLQEWEGGIDEVRVSGAARSSDWLAADYRALQDAFITYGGVESQGTYAYRRPITVSAGASDLPADYPVNLTFDHANLVSNGKSQADGDDVRVAYWDGSAWTEVERRLDSGASWNANDTVIWLETAVALDANVTDGNYALHYGNTAGGSPPDSALLGTGVKSVQQGTTTSSANGFVNVTIGTVDPNKSFLFFGTRHDSNRPPGSELRGRILNGTTLQFERVTNESSTMTVSWYVVEYYRGVNVQRGETAQTASTLDIPISPVGSVDQAFVTWSKTPEATSNIFDQDDALRCWVFNTTTVRCHVTNANSAFTIWWEVVEFTNPEDVATQSGTVDLWSGTLSATDNPAPSVNTSRTFLLAGYNTSGGGADIGARMLRANLTSGTTVTLDRSIGGNADDLTATWQTIQLNDGTRVFTGSQNFPSGNSTQVVSIGATVDPDRAAAFASVQVVGGQNMGRSPYSGDDVIGVGSFTATLTATQVTLTRDNTAASADVVWFVVEFERAKPNVSLGAEETPGVEVVVAVYHTQADGSDPQEIVTSFPVTIDNATANPLTVNIGNGEQQIFSASDPRRLRLEINATAVNGERFVLAYDSASEPSRLETPTTGPRPQLTNPTLNPTSGDTTTPFNFTVEYSHPDGTPANVVTVNVSDAANGTYNNLTMSPAQNPDRDYFVQESWALNGTVANFANAQDDADGGAYANLVQGQAGAPGVDYENTRNSTACAAVGNNWTNCDAAFASDNAYAYANDSASGIGIGNVQFAGTTASDTLDITNVAISGVNRYLLVGFCFNNDNSQTVNSVLIDPGGSDETSLTHLDGVSAEVLNDGHCSLWGVVAPPVGTFTVRITISSANGGGAALIAGAWPLTGVDQTDPRGSVVEVSGNGDTTTLTIPSGPGEVAFATMFIEDNSDVALQSPSTEDWNTVHGGDNGAGAHRDGASPDVDITWTHTRDKRVGIGVSMKPAPLTPGKNDTAWRGYGFGLNASDTVNTVEVGVEWFRNNTAPSLNVSVSWDGGASWATNQTATNQSSDPNSLEFLNFTSATAWDSTKLSDANLRVRIGTNESGARLDYVVVRVNFTTASTSTTVLLVQWNTSGIRAGGEDVLRIRYNLTSSDDSFGLWVWDFAAGGWSQRATLDQTSATYLNYTLAADEKSGGEVRIRFNDTSDSGATNLSIDYQLVNSNLWTTGVTYYLNTTLAAGSYEHFFWANDTTGLWNRTANLPGPTVNALPVVTDFRLETAAGQSRAGEQLDVDAPYSFLFNVTDANGWTDIGDDGNVSLRLWYDGNQTPELTYEAQTTGANYRILLRYVDTADPATASPSEWSVVEGNAVYNASASTATPITDGYAFNLSLRLGFQVKQANDPTDGSTGDYNDPDSWNAEVVASDGSATATLQTAATGEHMEFGVFMYTFVNISGDWTVTLAPGQAGSTNTVTVHYRSNDAFRMTLWFTSHLVGPETIDISNVEILAAADPGDNITTDIAFAGLGEANGVYVFGSATWWFNHSADTDEDTVIVQFRVAIPLGTLPGTYTATLTIKVAQQP